MVSIFLHRCDDGVNRLGIDQRLVALYIDVNFSGNVRGDFGDAVGAAGMIATSHHRFTAKCLHGLQNPLVIGRDHYARDPLRLLRPLVNARNHRPSGDFRQRFARESRGIVARGNYDDRVLVFRVGHILDPAFRRGR